MPLRTSVLTHDHTGHTLLRRSVVDQISIKKLSHRNASGTLIRQLLSSHFMSTCPSKSTSLVKLVLTDLPCYPTKPIRHMSRLPATNFSSYHSSKINLIIPVITSF